VNDIGNDVRRTLEWLGYTKIQDTATGGQTAIIDIGDRYGTTNRTELLRDQDEDPHICRLIDVQTGEEIGKAWRPEPIDPPHALNPSQ
jgi:hypothetical protein